MESKFNITPVSVEVEVKLKLHHYYTGEIKEVNVNYIDAVYAENESPDVTHVRCGITSYSDVPVSESVKEVLELMRQAVHIQGTPLNYVKIVPIEGENENN